MASQSGIAIASITRLQWGDVALGAIDFPGERMQVTLGIGSGLARRAGDPPGIIWAIADRGPNVKPGFAARRLGLERFRKLRKRAGDGAKMMPTLEHGPEIVQLQVDADAVRLRARLPLRDADGQRITGLAPPDASTSGEVEPLFDASGRLWQSDPSGVDSEGLAALRDGRFWVAEEYLPSLLLVDADGVVIRRIVPAGTAAVLAGCRYPLEEALPAIAAARKLNRGFEAVALTPDERFVYVAFQSPLAHPDRHAHDASDIVRLWRLDAQTGALDAEFHYELDPPGSFLRDKADAGTVEPGDRKISELLVLDDAGTLLVLERVAHSSRLYRVTADAAHKAPAWTLDAARRPALEQLDTGQRAAAGMLALAKTPVLDSDRHPELPPDLEGMALLDPSTLLLVNDNDFGVDGVATQFWRVRFAQALVQDHRA